MKYSEYNNPNNWIGGFYELSIEFHPVGDNERLNQALMAIQSFKLFKGIWRERQDFQAGSISLPINIDNDSVIQFYGTLIMNDGNTLPCLISIIRIKGESDWLDVSIPQASFEKFYPYKYPLTKELNPWLVRVDEIFIGLAETIFNHSSFELAMIGEEISGSTNQGQIALEDVGKIICILPTHLQKRLGIKEKGIELTNQLRLFC
ncbi:hypothetical protein [Neobacillus sp. PS2-9]|uniref:hypothetical protein n=1 Tax=Neobacillus sp. PS2-9 TaxID=3070676 RepID=UPI0027DF7639|nr:hypothetical protein [Neobacillus sp. PS2-9]WML56095.1 hypothetical protein RCG25_14205 [Neobacillus sp. PS2-9]